MNDYTVVRYGTDSSGRGIWLTRYMHDWYEARCNSVGFRPVIVQGSFMTRDGGGAPDSSGAHDRAGCIDVRTKDLTTEQIDAWVHECRLHGGGAYRRDETARHGGMEPHCHVTLGTDRPLSPMAQTLWSSYLNGGDGLAGAAGRASDAPDYEWRPSPLVLVPPKEEWSDMATQEQVKAACKEAIAEAIGDLVPVPPNEDEGVLDPKNPKWGAGPALGRIWRLVKDTHDKEK